MKTLLYKYTLSLLFFPSKISVLKWHRVSIRLAGKGDFCKNVVFLSELGRTGPPGLKTLLQQSQGLDLKRQNVALLPLSELMGPECRVNTNEQFSFLLEYEPY